jgi:transcriptional regulator with XRE-family HTH domain
MNDFGTTLTDLRKAAGLSQAQLAEKLGLSQTTISRLESAKVFTGDVGVVAKIARFFKTPLKELLPHLDATVTGETFFAFCPNPSCFENQTGSPQKWKSFKEYPANDYPEVNFCPSCGTSLCKECPSCQKKFDRKFTLFCVRCGTRVCDPPPESPRYIPEPDAEGEKPF